MMKMSPFISIDIETTGLVDDNPYVLQIGIKMFNWSKLDSPLDEILIYIDNGKLDKSRCGDYAMNMNKKILETIEVLRVSDASKKFLMTPEEANSSIKSSISKFSLIALGDARSKITPAGKNFANFDLPILLNNGFDFAKEFLSRRTLDPGPMYYHLFGYIPNLDEINKLLGRPPCNHDALNDARDVVYAIKKIVLDPEGVKKLMHSFVIPVANDEAS